MAMNKLLAILYVLYFVSYMMGCVAKSDYEVRLWMDRGADRATGYIITDGEKHSIEIEYND